MRNQSGQSLTELMVSIVIITVALSGIVAIFPFIIQKNARIKTQSEAVYLAQSELEKLKALPYFDRELDATGSSEGMVTIKQVKNYYVRTKVLYINSKSGLPPDEYPYDLSQDTGLKKIEVSVKRKDNIGGQVDLVTFISKAKPGKG